MLRSPAPALVVATPVAVGDVVAAGAPVLVLESMKMETVLRAPFAARVRELLVTTGSQVETGAPLVRLEPIGDGADDEQAAADETAPALDLPDGSRRRPPPQDAPHAPGRTSPRCCSATTSIPATRAPASWTTTSPRATSSPQPASTWSRDEIELLGLFADFAELSRNRPAGEDLHTELRVHSSREHFHTYLQSLDVERGGLPDEFRDRLARVLAHYGVDRHRPHPAARGGGLPDLPRPAALRPRRPARDRRCCSAGSPSRRRAPSSPDLARELLERLVRATQLRFPVVGDLARSVRFRWFDQPLVDAERASVLAGVRDEVAALAADPDAADRAERIDALAAIPEQIVRFLAERLESGVPEREPMLEVLVRRHYREYDLHGLRSVSRAEPHLRGRRLHPRRPADPAGRRRSAPSPSSADPDSALTARARRRGRRAQPRRRGRRRPLPALARGPGVAGARPPPSSAASSARCRSPPTYAGSRSPSAPAATVRSATSPTGRAADGRRGRGRPGPRRAPDGRPPAQPVAAAQLRRHPLEAPEDVLLYECVARENPADQRLVALAQVRQLAVVRDERGQGHRRCRTPSARWRTASRRSAGPAASRGAAGSKLDINHVWVQVWPRGRGRPRPADRAAGQDHPADRRRRHRGGAGAGPRRSARTAPPSPHRDPLPRPTRRRGDGLARGAADRAARSRSTSTPPRSCGPVAAAWSTPTSSTGVLAGPDGSLVEHDLDDTGALVPVDRPRGLNKAGILVGVVTTPTALHPEGVTRVVLCGDPTKALGAVSEPECSRIIAALDLAEQMRVPVEWFALSAGARISMDSGTENMDWVAAALKRIIEFTQAGGEINVVVAGINVGAQPYWNAEATMLMHTKGILVMTPDSAMVLTGKQSLDFSGGVSAEDNFGIGGYDRVMGPNGQAQYWAPDLAGAFGVLMAHYDHTYVVPGRGAAAPGADHRPGRPRRLVVPARVRRTATSPPSARSSPRRRNPDRKKAFDIRTVMRAVADQDHPTLERWAGMADADTAVVQDAHLGGHPVCLLGIESRPVPRRGFPPTDGPDTYTAGTLFPRSSKKAARAINAASGNRPLVVLANLSGLRRLTGLDAQPAAGVRRRDRPGDRQLRRPDRVLRDLALPRRRVRGVLQGAEPEHDGAGARGLVRLGHRRRPGGGRGLRRRGRQAHVGRPAGRASSRPRSPRPPGPDRSRLVVELAELRAAVRPEKIGEVAAEFDGVHDIHRAVRVGSVDEVITARRLRPRIIEAIEQGLAVDTTRLG